VGGWAAIRFVADNPGKTLMSKHITWLKKNNSESITTIF
jgi:hypothetical protein